MFSSLPTEIIAIASIIQGYLYIEFNLGLNFCQIVEINLRHKFNSNVTCVIVRCIKISCNGCGITRCVPCPETR